MSLRIQSDPRKDSRGATVRKMRLLLRNTFYKRMKNSLTISRDDRLIIREAYAESSVLPFLQKRKIKIMTFQTKNNRAKEDKSTSV